MYAFILFVFNDVLSTYVCEVCKGIMRWQQKIWNLVGCYVDCCSQITNTLSCDPSELAKWNADLKEARNNVIREVRSQCIYAVVHVCVYVNRFQSFANYPHCSVQFLFLFTCIFICADLIHSFNPCNNTDYLATLYFYHLFLY